MESATPKKFKRTTDFSIKSLMDQSSHANETVVDHSTSSSSSCSPTSNNGMMCQLSWNKPNSSTWLPDAEIIDKARASIIDFVNSLSISVCRLV